MKKLYHSIKLLIKLIICINPKFYKILKFGFKVFKVDVSENLTA